MPENPPGLVRRTVTDTGGDTITIQELWDTKIPGCAFVVLPWVRRTDVRSIQHTFHVPRGHPLASKPVPNS